MNIATPKVKKLQRSAARLTLAGRVQGIGLRPAVARFAQQLSLAGYVRNTHGGVEIYVEGLVQRIEQFERELNLVLPSSAEVSSLQCVRVEPIGLDSFVVGQAASLFSSAPNISVRECNSTLTACVPPDVVVCDACLTEVRDLADRRRGFPFTSCTNCGPRYSIIERMPYEREQSSMAVFPLCDRCRSEYESTTNRRFHAQTNACPECGPKICLRDANNRVMARGDKALQAAADVIFDGQIVALRGLGGYQLLLDGTSQEAVDRLRRRKQRRDKPLAVMVSSLEEAKKLARLDETEERLLCNPSAPIIIAAIRDDARLASSVTAGLNTVGLMLPTTPLHGLLLDVVKRPLVCTSANIEGEPIVFDGKQSLDLLRGIADCWVEHNRPIRRPIDDSVVRVIAGRPVTIRLARGYAPLSLDLKNGESLIALGGQQKTSIALCNGAQAVLGPHIGDLDSVATRQRFVEQLGDISRLYGIDHSQIICDQHPEYFTTGWAEEKTDRVIQVQHHHAHVVAGMLQHGWLDRQVLGVSFDGTGYGNDGTIWGGEFLVATNSGFERVGHLHAFPLVGGERAVREPWRVATALVRAAMSEEQAAGLAFQTGDARALLPILRNQKLSPITTSAGRLFDGVAALVLGTERCKFEGQAAMLLEATCDLSAQGQYDIPIDEQRPKQLDWRPLVRQILRDRDAGESPAAIATRFHRGLAAAIFDFCRCYPSLPVVLGGGVFQNKVLVELLVERFDGAGQPVGLPGSIPPNDGGLAAGQLAVAAFSAPQRSTISCV